MGDGPEDAAPWVHAARETRGAVEAALRRRGVAPRVRERLEMVKGVALGQPLAEVARWSGRGERTVVRWVRAFVTGGIVALADAPRSGRPVRADAAYLAALEALEHAVDTPPRTLGLLFDTWTSPRLSAYLAETPRRRGVRIAPGWVRALLARQRFRVGRPNDPQHTLGHLQDPVARAVCEEVLQAVGEKGACGRGRVRAALPGWDPPRYEPAPDVRDVRVAPHRGPAHHPGGRHEPAADVLRQR